MKRTTIQKRAARGAAFMDQKRPGWHNEIELGLLDIECGACCILGQIYNDYGQGTGKIGISYDQQRQYDLGLMATPINKTQKYRELTAAWKTEIRIRRTRVAKNIMRPKRANTSHIVQPTRS